MLIKLLNRLNLRLNLRLNPHLTPRPSAPQNSHRLQKLGNQLRQQDQSLVDFGSPRVAVIEPDAVLVGIAHGKHPAWCDGDARFERAMV